MYDMNKSQGAEVWVIDKSDRIQFCYPVKSNSMLYALT